VPHKKQETLTVNRKSREMKQQQQRNGVLEKQRINHWGNPGLNAGCVVILLTVRTKNPSFFSVSQKLHFSVLYFSVCQEFGFFI
jgi:hypothetical protein